MFSHGVENFCVEDSWNLEPGLLAIFNLSPPSFDQIIYFIGNAVGWLVDDDYEARQFY